MEWQNIGLNDLRACSYADALRRGMKDYYTPRHMLLSLLAQVGEVADAFRWKSPLDASQVDKWNERDKRLLREALAESLVGLLRLADTCHVDLGQEAQRRVQRNQNLYPSHGVGAEHSPSLSGRVDTQPQMHPSGPPATGCPIFPNHAKPAAARPPQDVCAKPHDPSATSAPAEHPLVASGGACRPERACPVLPFHSAGGPQPDPTSPHVQPIAPVSVPVLPIQAKKTTAGGPRQPPSQIAPVLPPAAMSRLAGAANVGAGAGIRDQRSTSGSSVNTHSTVWSMAPSPPHSPGSLALAFRGKATCEEYLKLVREAMRSEKAWLELDVHWVVPNGPRRAVDLLVNGRNKKVDYVSRAAFVDLAEKERMRQQTQAPPPRTAHPSPPPAAQLRQTPTPPAVQHTPPPQHANTVLPAGLKPKAGSVEPQHTAPAVGGRVPSSSVPVTAAAATTAPSAAVLAGRSGRYQGGAHPAGIAERRRKTMSVLLPKNMWMEEEAKKGDDLQLYSPTHFQNDLFSPCNKGQAADKEVEMELPAALRTSTFGRPSNCPPPERASSSESPSPSPSPSPAPPPAVVPVAARPVRTETRPRSPRSPISPVSSAGSMLDTDFDLVLDYLETNQDTLGQAEFDEIGIFFCIPYQGKVYDLIPSGQDIPVTLSRLPEFIVLAKMKRLVLENDLGE